MAGHTTGFLITIVLLLGAALIAFIGWRRTRRERAQQEAQRILHNLSEDIIAAPSPSVIAEKLSVVLPTITQATSVNLYLYQRRTKSLERVPTTTDPEPMAAPLDAPPEGLANAAVVCFRNRTLLNVPDVRRNPLVKVGPKISLPKSAFFVPLLSQQEALGVLEIGNSRKPGFFSQEEQAGIQHLANQAAAALKLQERTAMREQLFHSEKLAATGQLISGVASELSAPLESIVQLAATLAAHQGTAPSQRDLLKLVGESQRASEIVSRLVSFAREEEPAPHVLDVNTLASELMRFREPEWRLLGLKTQDRLSPEKAPILGSRGQIEQVFLNLLVYAEQHAAQSPAKSLSMQSSVIARRILVEISYGAAVEDPAATVDPFTPGSLLGGGALGLSVCQGIVRSHGGEVRFRSRSGSARFEVELPLTQEDSADTAAPLEPRKVSRSLTVMVVDTDAAAQKHLLGLLSTRGHRVVPVSSQEAPDLAQRLRFDAVFWSLHHGSGNWTEASESLRSLVPLFVLVGDGYDAELARHLEQNQGFLLSRPVQETELDRVLAQAEARTPAK
ncbi:MAG TPA: GAF domain-containing protein [Bryobacteraceae bacterium]|jgi:signal transduction histidine kinase/CheY-like chemotaxis protein